MNKLELTKKILNAKKDIEEGQNILQNFNRHKVKVAEEWINKCNGNTDYIEFIVTNKIINNLCGNLRFSQLEFNLQLNALNCVIQSIQTYLAKLTREEFENTDDKTGN